jgi:hypothetical protein
MDAGVLTYLPFRGSRDGTGTAILPGVKPSHQSRSTAPGRHCNAWTTLEEPAGSEHRNGLHRPRPAPRRESPRRRARSSRSRPLTRVRRVPATSAPLLGRSALGLAHGRPEGSSPSAGSSHRPASRGPCRRAAFRSAGQMQPWSSAARQHRSSSRASTRSSSSGLLDPQAMRASRRHESAR